MMPLDLLMSAIRAKSGAPGGVAPPAAILWTDHRREWDSLIPVARSRLPELLVLGEYDPGRRTGPAIWLRCVVDGAADLPDVPADRPPIIYLPGVERGELRAGEDCQEALRPLVELMYRGVAWHHPNGRDWSARAFLTLRTDGVPAGPGLDIAKDAASREALVRAIGEVARSPLDDLRGRRLDANDFNRLAGVDVVRDTLRWLDNAEATRDEMDDRRWAAFRDEARRELRFDPGEDPDVEAGRRLAAASGRWSDVWSRFSDTPRQFPRVADVLGRSRPGGVLPLEGRDRWPDLNDDDEAALRDSLAKLPGLTHTEACRRVQELEEEHGRRRDWVWARMERSPFAEVLRPLACLAAATEHSIGGRTPDDIARVYAERGWQADRAAREALAQVRPEGEAIIRSAVRHLHEHWLRESTEAFQTAARAPAPWSHGAGAGAAAPSATKPEDASLLRPGTVPANAPVIADENECIFFVDGLRYELGRCLASHLEEAGLKATVRTRWAAIPTVTATAKPAVTPVAGDITGDHLGADFRPVLRGSSRPVTASVLRDSMEERGYEIVGDGSLALGPVPGARGWLETSRIDHHGHHHGAVAFAQLIDRELDRLGRRVHELLDAGWRTVRIITDHGWLLLPNGLPMVTLPRHLTESKWARCAVLAGDSRPEAPLHPWHWNGNQRFASPPGIACFSQRPEYAHGGLSVQECLIPEIRVRTEAGAAGEAAYRAPARTTIRSVSWRRMRCDIQVEPSTSDATADLRLGSVSGESVASRQKAIDADGCASLILDEDAHAAAALVIVVTGPDGRILAQQATRKGDGR